MADGAVLETRNECGGVRWAGVRRRLGRGKADDHHTQAARIPRRGYVYGGAEGSDGILMLSGVVSATARASACYARAGR